MVNTPKTNKVKPISILGKLPVIFLAFIFLIVAGSLLLRYSISQKLTTLNTQLSTPAESGDINDILLDLSSAENDFQQASLYGYEDELNQYKEKLKYIFDQIEALVKKHAADSMLQVADRENAFKKQFDGKLDVSLKVFELKKSFDSLLIQTTTENLGALSLPPAVINPGKIAATGQLKLVDTVVHNIEKPVEKKNLFGRLKDAITNKPDSQVTKVIEINREKSITDSISRIINIKAENERIALLKKLGIQHNRLTASQNSLLEANRSLIIQLRQLVDEIRVLYFKNWENNRNVTLAQYKASVNVLNNFTLVAILLVLVFIILLLFSIRKSAKAEQQIRAENARAIALAEQKSELLAIMSHEIRNPLTTIAGYVYMLERAGLTAQQQELLKPIKQASALLQDTVDDILDMSKFESLQAAALNKVSFLPNKEIRETIENMQFSATRKGIELGYQFEGEDGLNVIGDAFRLKQVTINVLSNAIKYTEKGSIVVKAILALHTENALLTVSITDTGIGIAPDQQAKLFAKYYQADKASGKPGTGLGLYICDQLIRLQNGKIQVQSEPGKGSVFTFEIPYQLSDTQ